MTWRTPAVNPSPTASALDGRHRWCGAVAVFTGAVMGTVDTFVLYVATPHLRGIFSATAPEISWISTSYATASLVAMLISGWFSDRFGRKTVYQWAIATFLLASITCGLSASLQMLIAARIVQGAAAGILLAVEITILRQTFPPDELGKVIGFYGATTMIGPGLGPLLGGWIIDNYHWSYIFFLNVPVGIFGMFMVERFVTPDAPAGRRSDQAFDWFGLILLTFGMFCLIWLLERGDRLFWFEDTSNTVLLWAAIGSLAYFVAHELETRNPLVNFRVLRVREFALVVALNFVLYFVVTGTLFVLPIYMQELLRFSPTKSGATLAPRALAMMVFFPLVGWLFKRVPAKVLVCSGLAIGLYSALLMRFFTHETGVGDMALPLIAQGLAVTLVLVPLTSVGLSHVDKAEVPAASALDSTVRQLGGGLGIAVFATLITRFQLEAWAEFRHSVSLFSPLFYDRFGRVKQFFMMRGLDDHTVGESAFRLLNARVTQQVNSVTYRNIFELVALAFASLLLVALVVRIRRLQSLSAESK